jgi:RNA polymerase sigma-70 factor (ECF subfamily)
LLALLVGRFRRLDLAEDALADAFEAAARTWRRDGIPGNPAAWLLTAARRRAVDRLRAEAVAARTEPLLVVDARTQQEAQRAMADPGDQVVTDERLRLVFLCAHPSLAPEAAAALTLRMVLGISTADLARLFLVPEPTMAARLTRARKKLAVAGVPFVVPPGDRIPERVDVLATVAYLAFTAGYAPGSGPDVLRAELAGEAVRLTRLLRELMPGHAALDALLALMLLQHSRRDARVSPDGRLVLLPEQDRSRWHVGEIAEALALLAPWQGAAPEQIERLDPRAAEYLLQALIAAEHALAPSAADTDWHRIAARYAVLEVRTGSPAVRLARAVAVAEAHGPQAGLALLDGMPEALPGSHRVPAVRAELLARAGLAQEAVAAYERAIGLCANEAERVHLVSRKARVADLAGQPGGRQDGSRPSQPTSRS